MYVCLYVNAKKQNKKKKKKTKELVKLAKIYKIGHISDAISPTDFILGTKVQLNKAQSMAQVLMTLTEGQGQRSMSNLPLNA